jgi:hypothetical protein
MQMNELVEQAGTGGDRGNSDGSTSRNAADHPHHPETTAAESLPAVKEWEWI